MTPTEAPRRRQPYISITARALDLALDGRLSLDDGADHLRRLADRQGANLEAALCELPVAPDTDPAVECARLLLYRALAASS